MPLETSPTQKKSPKDYWVKVPSYSNASLKSNSKFFYIGKTDEAVQALSNCFQAGTIVENYAQAQRLIDKANITDSQIDVIFIDLPLEKADLEKFCAYLKGTNLLTRTPIIYNEQKLDIASIRLLHDLHLIDDVVNLTSEAIDYCSKISFIRKIKSQQTLYKVPVPKTTLYGLNTEALRLYASRKLNTGRNIFTFKRLIDVVVAALALLILMPIFVLIAIGIKISSKGPVFYTSPRAGRGFKIFDFYKFRTMEVDADKKIEALAHLNQYGASDKGPIFFKLSDDPRITKFGKFLRNTSLDELPQLFNVLKGDMSLVGNRPLPLYEAATLTTNEFVERFMAPAGITGLWQIKKRGQAEMSIEERINLDILYARRANLMYDLRIMASTPGALFQKSNV
jgi:lipopolysaccharide/colanic/teichoic acid biosynthesis glycosyltransferase